MPGTLKSVAVPVAMGALLQLLAVWKVMVVPPSALPCTSGLKLVREGAAGTVVIPVGTTGLRESWRYEMAAEQSEMLPATSRALRRMDVELLATAVMAMPAASSSAVPVAATAPGQSPVV